ncbi:hypothetical protein HD806DRAFT_516744 [Xylariaceae sp. AK1471]|nr:hypothetical protein HD806DRAFT_516744 [Xylariaceae sp. AK1471]
MLPLEQIRRIASLSYAVEPLLFTLHEPFRRLNKYYPSLQDSFLPHKSEEDIIFVDGIGRAVPHDEPGFLDEIENFGLDYNGPNATQHPKPGVFECLQYLGRDRRHGEAPLSARENGNKEDIRAFLETRRPGHFEPFTKPGDSRHTEEIQPHDISRYLDLLISKAQVPSTITPPAVPARQRNIPRIQLPQYDVESLTRDGRSSQFEVIQQIYSQTASCNICHLLSGHMRPSVSLHSYQCDLLKLKKKGKPERIYGIRWPEKPPLRTIEFTYGDCSLKTEWINTWAKICIGLFKFALYASPSQFIDILTNCDRAIRENGTYDVIDLLDDIGLFAEAEVAEKRLIANMDLWSLKFAETES